MASISASISHKVLILPHIIKHIPKRPVLAEELEIYAFDLDHTLIQPKSGGRFSRTADDWCFMCYSDGENKPESTQNAFSTRNTLDKLCNLIKDNPKAQIVVFSNQGGVITVPPTSKSCLRYTGKIDQILKEISLRDTPTVNISNRVWIYASPKKPSSLFSKKSSNRGRVAKLRTSKDTLSSAPISPEVFDHMRKPNVGMYEEFRKDFQQSVSFKCYCGDAAGRKKDFSDSDKVFARNLGVEFVLPELFFKLNSQL